MKRQKNKNKQKGVALAIGMILLLTVSIIGITSMKSAMLEDRMAAGLKNRELSDAAALSMLSAAEHWIYAFFRTNNGTDLTEDSCQYCIESRSLESLAFRTEKSLTYGGFTHPQGVSINAAYGGVLAEEPKFIIELMKSSTNNYAVTVGESGGGDRPGEGGEAKLRFFRVVSKATDSSGHMYSAYESVFTAVLN
ncbi:MAG: hypothetical protein JKY19_11370 [Alcanivoracaceae bacterium]|nr:hypothetical protein [Alcanivoracaceae bacterium]